ncbi:hypothetical protein DYB31_015340 [Aphanomyces astaci]|uniref:Uncharacterized protein n=1 Tax=Aphanomyces astaci TaxID=112090 RepID=A0A397EH16_APHAT|nr:hypothetical protein DYB31_015340 [Aphanomyces astaci]
MKLLMLLPFKSTRCSLHILTNGLDSLDKSVDASARSAARPSSAPSYARLPLDVYSHDTVLEIQRGGSTPRRGDTVLVVTRPNVPLAPSSDQRSAVDVLMQHIREHDTKEALCCFKLD